MRTLTLFFFVVSAALPATITLSTTCVSPTNTITGDGSCGVQNATGSANAEASATFTVSANTLNLDATTSATASTGGNSIQFGYAPFLASANVTITANLYTTGSARQGYLQVSGGSQTGNGGDGGSSSSYSVGSATSSSCPVNSSCNVAPGAVLIPIELGTTFTFAASQSANGNTDPVDFLGDGKAITAETFTFFESDGITPVAVFDASPVPEPAAFALFALGSTVIVAVRRKR